MSSYATPANLVAFGLSAQALAGFTADQQQAALDAASDVADGYLRSRFRLPLATPVTADLKRAVCAVAAFDLLTSRGFNPEAGADTVVRLRYEDALKWLRDVADERVTPALSDSSGSTPAPRAPLIVSAPPRGW